MPVDGSFAAVCSENDSAGQVFQGVYVRRHGGPGSGSYEDDVYALRGSRTRIVHRAAESSRWRSESERGGGLCFQVLHDGGTLDSGDKYQAVGLQFVSLNFERNVVACIAFSQIDSGTAGDIADLIKEQVANLDLPFGMAIGAIQQDAAAGAVATELLLEREVCLMHSGDKVRQGVITSYFAACAVAGCVVD